jgi:AGZA family xanthine/uracil permease-like MFS transporter
VKVCETSAISNQWNELMTEADIKRDLITATAAISGLSSFVFGFLTNLPVALA